MVVELHIVNVIKVECVCVKCLYDASTVFSGRLRNVRTRYLCLVSCTVCTTSSLLRYVRTFNGPFSGTTRVSRYQKSKTNLDFTEARDSEWLWHQLGHMQVCALLQTNNYASTPPLSFLQARCPFCRPTNSVKALKYLQ